MPRPSKAEADAEEALPDDLPMEPSVEILPQHGTAQRAFAMVYHGALLPFREGQHFKPDAPLARYMVEHDAPVIWSFA